MAFAPYIDPRQYQRFGGSTDGRVPPPPDAKVPRRRLKATLSNGLMPNAPTIDDDADLLQQDDLAAIEPTPEDHLLTFMDEKDSGIGTDPLLAVGDGAPDAITAPPQAHATASRGNVPTAPRALPAVDTTGLEPIDPALVPHAAPHAMYGGVPQAPQEFKIHWGPQADGRVLDDVNLSAPAGYDYAGNDTFTPPPPLDVSDYGHDMAALRAPAPAKAPLPYQETDPITGKVRQMFDTPYEDWERDRSAGLAHIPDYIAEAQRIGDVDLADDLETQLTGVPSNRSKNTLSGQAALKNAERLERQAAQSLPPIQKEIYDSLGREIDTYQKAQQNLINTATGTKNGTGLDKIDSSLKGYKTKIDELKRQRQAILDQVGGGNAGGDASFDQLYAAAVSRGLSPEQARASVNQFLQGQ